MNKNVVLDFLRRFLLVAFVGIFSAGNFSTKCYSAACATTMCSVCCDGVATESFACCGNKVCEVCMKKIKRVISFDYEYPSEYIAGEVCNIRIEPRCPFCRKREFEKGVVSVGPKSEECEHAEDVSNDQTAVDEEGVGGGGFSRGNGRAVDGGSHGAGEGYSGVDSGKWVCLNCTLENDTVSDCCSVCYEPRGMWVCSLCTLINGSGEPVCSACGSNKPAESKSEEHKPAEDVANVQTGVLPVDEDCGKWACLCGWDENPWTSHRCVKCGSCRSGEWECRNCKAKNDYKKFFCSECKHWRCSSCYNLYSEDVLACPICGNGNPLNVNWVCDCGLSHAAIESRCGLCGGCERTMFSKVYSDWECARVHFGK